MDYRIFNVRTDVNTCSCTWGCKDTHKRVCTESWLWEKNPLLHRGIEPVQRRTGPKLHQLGHICSPFFLFNMILPIKWSLSEFSFRLKLLCFALITLLTGRMQEIITKPSCKAQRKGEEDKADRGRGGKTTSGNGPAWSSAGPRGQWRTGKTGENWLRNHLWCSNDPCG